METYTYQQYQQSAAALADRLGDFRPEVLLILGSGLGSLGDQVEQPLVVPYAQVPHMKRSTAPDHKGQFVFGRLSGRNVAVMQGRLHTYEGWSFADVSYPVRVLRLLGAKTLLVTNAAGAVNTAFSAGDIMMITDHIKLFGVSPLCGANLDEFGPRFPDVSAVYTPALRKAAREAAQALEIPLRESTCTSLVPSLRRLPRCGWPAFWAPTQWACPRCRRPLWPPTAGCRFWGLPSAPTWPPGCWTSLFPVRRFWRQLRRPAHGLPPW